MRHDPLVCVQDALEACKLIMQFTQGMSEDDFLEDMKTKAAVEREFEIIGEALNRLKNCDTSLLERIDNGNQIIGFRNVIAHGYDVVEDEILWNATQTNVPHLLDQLRALLKESS